MARSKVPKFGVWEGGENVAFTAQFETVRTGVPGGPIIKPNDFQANQGVLPPPQQTKPKQKQPAFGAWDEEEEVPYTLYFENQVKAKASPSEPQMNYNVVPTQPLKTSPVVKAGRGSELRKPNDSHQPHGGRGMSSDEPRAKPQGVKFVDGGSSAKQSLRHPEATGRGRGSSPIDNNRGAPVGTRQRPHATAGPSPGRAGATVPVFGDWNNNPSQAEGYTVVFNKLQEDRRKGNVDISPSRPHYSPGRSSKQPKQGGCFSWLFG